jgi:cation diffusion facilitator CzcD-associated flavoprotein CzcO
LPSIRDPELRRKLTPNYDFGCKRPTFSNDYYRTFTKPHVHPELSEPGQSLRIPGTELLQHNGISVAADGSVVRRA